MILAAKILITIGEAKGIKKKVVSLHANPQSVRNNATKILTITNKISI